MKYKYIPNCRVIDYRQCKEVFRFDKNGEFETNDPKLIDWIKKNKNFLNPIDEAGKGPKDPKEPKVKVYKCKKCGEFETENMGELLAHYRNEHPKGDD